MADRRWVDSGGLRLAVREQGRTDGAPTILLVHGYPDNSAVWDGVAGRLAERFRVVRYDLRGHGDSEEPAGRDGYRIAHLVGDLNAVLETTGPDTRVHLVAHDWGSIMAWTAVGDPHIARRLASFTSISGPSLEHIAAWGRNPRRLPVALRQAARSWYMSAFQVPVVPELVWRIPKLRAMFHADHRDARNGLQLYRANMFTERAVPSRTQVPVLQIALTQDQYCLPALLPAADPWCDRLWRRELAAGHWAIRTHPDAVARFVTEFVDHLEGHPASRELARARVGQENRPLAGRLILVTGAGSGIGRSSALAFAEAGADVLCLDIDVDTAEDTARQVAAHGSTGLAYRLDVADGAATRELADEVITQHGVPDIVMANAGVGVSGPFLDTTEDDWRRVLDVNLLGVVNTLRAFLPPMVRRGEGGHVVITASMAGYFATPNLPAYSTTKAGVLMLAQCLAGELRASGIGVSAICPGVVHTNITNTTRFAGAGPEEERARREWATAAYRRRGYGPDRVAKAVLKAVRDNRLVVPVTPEARIVSAGARAAPALTRALGRWIAARADKVARRGE
ncbi:MAG TPA: SDR family oxidoreductase [Actinophytocola sp.]|uniref:SDR family oxidoreductase n=1 Tax=Actinophytocola sp. TaxID=1872138 RepID=UPI002DDD2326|nr:SDR family oxidoreductase [Actinophytocola sp.]HEV2778302.1 SDR family oxidoreductase [Actinophytocola sp.]